MPPHVLRHFEWTLSSGAASITSCCSPIPQVGILNRYWYITSTHSSPNHTAVDTAMEVRQSAQRASALRLAGCTSDDSPPTQGDIRLVDLDDITANTQPCDAVHFGGVEIFNDDRYGRVCTGRFGGGDTADFTIDAQVACRQLGFPFGGLYVADEPRNSTGRVAGADYDDYSESGELVWATDVLCTGVEERLDECFFPEEFGDRAAFAPAGAGVSGASCRRRDGLVLGVVCRQFEIEGAPRVAVPLDSRELLLLPDSSPSSHTCKTCN